MPNEYFKTIQGVPQGDPLSPLLFDVFVDPLLRTLDKENIAYSFSNNRDNAQFMYADDFIIICESPKDLQKAIDLCKKVCDKLRMTANVKKSATMTFNRQNIKTGNERNSVFLWGKNCDKSKIKTNEN